jgi:hypothetical protein
MRLPLKLFLSFLQNTSGDINRHRYRMGSSLKRVSNFTFGTTLLVAIPSYYMCCKTKIWNKKVIEEMMAANQFEHESYAPSQPALEDHPFLTKVAEGEVSEK